MMNKKSQSILDIILPTDISRQYKTMLNNKEAQVLYEIWDSGSERGDIYSIPKNTDEKMVLSLKNKGYLDFKATGSMTSSRSIAKTSHSDKVEFTRKAKEAIKKIVLHLESSSFENNKNSKIDYQLALSAEEKGTTKTASVHKNIGQSWLHKAM